MEKKERKIDRRSSDELMLYLGCAVCVALAAALLFGQGLDAKFIIYCGCAFAMALGIFLVLKYLFGKGFTFLNDYSFAYGTLMVLLSICGFVRAADIVEHLPTLTGAMTLVMGVYLLQDMVQFAKLGNGVFWKLDFTFSLLSITAAMMVIMKVEPVLSRIENFGYWALLISAVLVTLSNLISHAAVKRYHKKKEEEERLKEEAEKAEKERQEREIEENKKRLEEQQQAILQQALENEQQAEPALLPEPKEAELPVVTEEKPE